MLETKPGATVVILGAAPDFSQLLTMYVLNNKHAIQDLVMIRGLVQVSPLGKESKNVFFSSLTPATGAS